MQEHLPSPWRRAFFPALLAFSLCVGGLLWRAWAAADSAAPVLAEAPRALAWGIAAGLAGFLTAAIWFQHEGKKEERARRQGPLLATLGRDGWIQCPRCHVTFSLGDPRAWQNGRHLSCGSELELVREDT